MKEREKCTIWKWETRGKKGASKTEIEKVSKKKERWIGGWESQLHLLQGRPKTAKSFSACAQVLAFTCMFAYACASDCVCESLCARVSYVCVDMCVCVRTLSSCVLHFADCFPVLKQMKEVEMFDSWPKYQIEVRARKDNQDMHTQVHGRTCTHTHTHTHIHTHTHTSRHTHMRLRTISTRTLTDARGQSRQTHANARIHWHVQANARENERKDNQRTGTHKLL